MKSIFDRSFHIRSDIGRQWRPRPEVESFLTDAEELEDPPMSEDELRELQALGYR